MVLNRDRVTLGENALGSLLRGAVPSRGESARFKRRDRWPDKGPAERIVGGMSAGSVDSGFREALPVPLRGRGGSESDDIRAGLDRNGGMEYGRNR